MFSRLYSFLTAWTRRERFEDSLDEEVRFHLGAYTEDLIRLFVSFTAVDSGSFSRTAGEN